MAERVGSSQNVYGAVLHCDAPDEGNRLTKEVAARLLCAELLTVEAGPIIGAHAGPGALGVAFYTA